MSFQLSVAVMVAVSLSWVTQAGAATYNWSYSDVTYSGSGTFTTTDGSSPFTITSISGSFAGSNFLQLLDPGSCCGGDDNNNLFYTPTTAMPRLLDGNGFAFENFGPGYFQIFWFDADGTYVSEDGNSLITSGGTFTATQQLGEPGPLPVPEPASLGIVLAAFGFVSVAAFINGSRRRTIVPTCRPQTSLT
jgi:hypothetical protein